MARQPIWCMSDAEVREAALQRAEEVGEKDLALQYHLLFLGWGVGDDEPIDDHDRALLTARPDIPSWTTTDTGAAVMLGGRVTVVGQATHASR